MLNNASGWEMVYTAAMLVALGASVANYLWARARRIAGERSGENGVLALMRQGSEQDQIKLVGVCVCMVIFGFNALLAPANPRAATLTTLVSGVVFLALSAIVLWLTFSIRRRPGKLRAAHDKEEAQHGGS